MALRLVASAGRPDILVDCRSVVVGRDSHCDFRLVSPRVSRWHCSLTEVDGAVWVRDLGSTNGTWINGEPVMSGRMRPGDVLAIAHIRYRLDGVQADQGSSSGSPDRLDAGSNSLSGLHDTAIFDERDGS